MGLWLSCQNCAGTGANPCDCQGRDPGCPHCGGRGVTSCERCRGNGDVYITEPDPDDEYEFVYDEY